MKVHNCDICGSSEHRPIWVAQTYIGDAEPPVICQNCGFVFIRERRSSQEIAEDWKRIYAEGLYDPNWPGVKARLYYVAEWIEQNIGWKDKMSLDIGGGDKKFSRMIVDRGAIPVSYDPAFGDTIIEDASLASKYDIVTILWTLENCGDCNAMISKARECLKPDGHLIVATGSRILVPFRKPMSMYFSTEPQDLHAFRWSWHSLKNILYKHDFAELRFNDQEQNDVLLVCAKPYERKMPVGYRETGLAEAVENHFIDWYRAFP